MACVNFNEGNIVIKRYVCKYKKYRIIGVIVVIVAIAVLFAANIRIRSVRQYRSDANNLVQEQQSISDLLNSTTKDEVDNKESSATRDDGAVTIIIRQMIRI